jgi:hypothetical protein
MEDLEKLDKIGGIISDDALFHLTANIQHILGKRGRQEPLE